MRWATLSLAAACAIAGCALVGDFSRYTVAEGSGGAGAGTGAGGAQGGQGGSSGGSGGGACAETEKLCANGQDDDCDGKTDCDDADCQVVTCEDLGVTCGTAAPPCGGSSLACDNGKSDGDETGKDCGGDPKTCETRCGTGEQCTVADDCVSQVCSGSGEDMWATCQAPACGDGVTNQAEEECDDGNQANYDGCVGCKPEAPHLLISELADEGLPFVEIYNPTNDPVDLSRVFLSNAHDYYKWKDNPGIAKEQFVLGFPDKATIQPHGFVTVAIPSGKNWSTPPDYDIDAMTAAPDMVGKFQPESVITKDNGVLVLFYWDGVSDLVEDIDYLLYGDGNSAIDKTGQSVGQSTYQPETNTNDQKLLKVATAKANKSIYRCDTVELTEKAGGNGSDGDDQTSEDAAFAFKESDPPTPGKPPDDTTPCTP